MAILNLIMCRGKEDVSGLKESLDMLALQRKVKFDDVCVTIVQLKNNDGILIDTAKYPFPIEVIRTKTESLSEACNECIRQSDAEWLMFMDYGDRMSDVYSLSMILNVLPTDEFDMMWTQYYSEHRMPNGDLFVNVVNDADETINEKLFRKRFLTEKNVEFDERMKHSQGEVFLTTAKSATDYSRFVKITTKFIPYLHVEKTIQHSITEKDLLLRRYESDMAKVRNTRLHGEGYMYIQSVMDAMCDAYYMLHMKTYPGVTEIIHNGISKLYKENRRIVDRMKPEDIEVFMYDSGVVMVNMIQTAYLAYGYEMRYDIDVESFDEWLKNGCTPYDIERQTNATVPHRSNRIHGSNGDRAAVFCGTRNVYDSMETAAKSLMYHTEMDRIYFLIEDDKFPTPLPDKIRTINVSGQEWFRKDGKNYNNAWTYMCLIRAAFAKLLPEEHKVLSLDIDVIINDDISELWDIDMTDYYIAGVPETQKTGKMNTTYVNFGVIMMNLDKIREDGIDDTIINSLNRDRWGCPEQDAFNHFCDGKIYALPGMYNATRAGRITVDTDVEKISHYAGIKYWKHYKPYRMFQQMNWDDVLRRKTIK